MPAPTFIDANVPMYAAGRAHPLKARCVDVLALVRDRPRAFFTNAEVLQEILHRYLTLNVWSQGRVLLDAFAVLMHDRVEPIQGQDVRRAAGLADQHTRLSARDLLHAAVMVRMGSTQIISADRAFDSVPDLVRFDPANMGVWESRFAPDTAW